MSYNGNIKTFLFGIKFESLKKKFWNKIIYPRILKIFLNFQNLEFEYAFSRNDFIISIMRSFFYILARLNEKFSLLLIFNNDFYHFFLSKIFYWYKGKCVVLASLKFEWSSYFSNFHYKKFRKFWEHFTNFPQIVF